MISGKCPIKAVGREIYVEPVVMAQKCCVLSAVLVLSLCGSEGSSALEDVIFILECDFGDNQESRLFL